MNLKSTELRIGNLISQYGLPKQITADLIKRLSEIEEAGKIAIDVSPIELTEYWLLELGFEPDEREVLKLYPLRVVPQHSGQILIGILDRIIASNIKYVHQLQNLYFSLTDQQLELKLKNPLSTNADKGQLS